MVAVMQAAYANAFTVVGKALFLKKFGVAIMESIFAWHSHNSNLRRSVAGRQDSSIVSLLGSSAMYVGTIAPVCCACHK